MDRHRGLIMKHGTPDCREQGVATEETHQGLAAAGGRETNQQRHKGVSTSLPLIRCAEGCASDHPFGMGPDK